MEQIKILLECLTTEEINIIASRVESIISLGKEDQKYDQILLAMLKELSKRQNISNISQEDHNINENKNVNINKEEYIIDENKNIRI